MYPKISQFGSSGPSQTPVQLNKGVKKNYPQLTEYLNLELKQQKLNERMCYPWQINCKKRGGTLKPFDYWSRTRCYTGAVH